MQARTAPRRAATRAVILTFLGLQLLGPILYYVGNDKEDERFAWRMFSSTRLRQCRVALVEEKEGRRLPVQLDPVLHVAWQRTLARGRAYATQKFLEQQCVRGDADLLHFYRQCKDVTGELLNDTQSMYCSESKVSR